MDIRVLDLILYLTMSFLWSIFAVRMHLKIGYPSNPLIIAFVWVLNFIAAPIALLVAIIKCPIGNSAEIGRNVLKQEVRDILSEEIEEALRGGNLPSVFMSEEDDSVESIYGDITRVPKSFLKKGTWLQKILK